MLREKTQRRLFRTLFVLGCLLPTLAIAGWAFSRYHPAFKAMVLAEVSRQAGVMVDCDSFSTPRPGVYQVVGLEVHDPYTEQLLVRADQVTAKKVGEAWQVSINEAWIEKPSSSSNKEFRLEDIPIAFSSTIESLTLGQTEKTLMNWERVKIKFKKDIDANLEDEACDSKLTFVSHTEAGTPDTQITLKQSYSNEQLVTKLLLDTGSTPHAGELLELDDSLADLAVESTFLGTCKVVQTGDRSEGEIKGSIQLANGDLGSSYGNWQQANILLQDVKWKGMMVTRFKGEIDVRSGAISRPIISGLITKIKCGNSKILDALWDESSNESIPYDQLACDIEFGGKGIFTNGLVLVGKCKNLEGGSTSGKLAYSILARKNKSLLLQPKEKNIPLWTVLQAFWPHSSAYVPVTADAQKLARLLPLIDDSEKIGVSPNLPSDFLLSK